MDTIHELEKIVFTAIENAKLRGVDDPKLAREIIDDQSFRVAFPKMWFNKNGKAKLRIDFDKVDLLGDGMTMKITAGTSNNNGTARAERLYFATFIEFNKMNDVQYKEDLLNKLTPEIKRAWSGALYLAKNIPKLKKQQEEMAKLKSRA